MQKLRLIDLLLLVADQKLEDGQMVLIANDCYKFDKKQEKFYVSTDRSEYRMINTYDIENTSTFNLNVLVSVC